MTITAKIIAHSVAPNGQQIVTFELQYPRFILAEFNTHRIFSRNSASSRAIPVKTIIDQVRNNPAIPIHFGANQSGMQASVELTGIKRQQAVNVWEFAADRAAESAEILADQGVHKQVANRILEPFQTMKTVMTATCMDNFFWLRNHEDAQPEIKELARLMWGALQASTPNELKPGEWHTPYFGNGYWRDTYAGFGFDGMSLEEALAISSSCCAQVSYRKLDDTLEKAQMVYKRLVESEPVHASPFEHSATPMERPFNEHWHNQAEPWQDGITHVDRSGNFWSGNLIGWVQFRQTIPNNVCHKYEP
ncbi:putative thymidylate synthase [Pseudomonas phage vB_PsyM_KIL3b]|uniref:Putative thymidylate synthase n=3 Tax=Pseudomonas phage vB_PsyM_KIL1 TaxID=1777065 RepID=A0A142IG32_9CAUD|nr:putative thymidylate synthase [Pseudomonas phage vB_PsyM_KIL1]AMR57368.1 putative thymidylate synthase [Pseudomonas phage vB_PsyM_KIL1]AMR57689.1 putative thymidylate synthase [Pseudomonas phage vB_PsyM_KIL3]AMR58187.1 putative thymidylate synthase [Pseudomonas phage vB_PsyM_KIL3b]